MTTTKTIPAAAKSQNRGGLLFVNQDATSPSSSQCEAAVRRKINRHVQHWQLGTKFAAKQRALREGPAFHILAGGNGRTMKMQERVLAGLVCQPLARESFKYSSRSLTPERDSTLPDTLNSQPLARKEQSEDEDILTLSCFELRLPPRLCSKGDNVDPFSCTASPIDHATYDLIQHYLRVIVPSTFRVEAQAYRFTTTRHAASTFDVVRRSMSNEMHMSALLAVSASRLSHVVKKDLGKNSAELFMYRAIKALRNHFRSDSVAIDQATILDVFWLFQAESYSRSYDASMVHLRIVKHLVESIGGLRTLDRYVMESIMIGDILVSIETWNPPIFPFVCDPGELDSSRRSALSLKTDLQLSHLGRGFNQGTFRPELRLIIDDVVSCMQMAQWVWSQSTLDPNDVKWTMLRSYSLLHRLLSVDQSQSDSRLFAREECCRVALLMWLGQVTTSTGIATRSGNMNAGRLKDRLLRYDVLNATRYTERRLLAWMLVVGAFATANIDAQAWFLVALSKILEDLKITATGILRNLLEEFFYLGTVQGKGLQRIEKSIFGE